MEGGKTYSACRKAIKLAISNPGCDGIMTEPTYPLLNQIMWPEMESAFKEFGIPFEFKRGEGIYYFTLPGCKTEQRIITASMENYERLIGINAAWCVLDEFDTTKADLAYKAYIKLLGRLRVGPKKQMVIVSTPEGFGAMYRIFITENNEDKRLIQARTTDNIFLPTDYIDTMRMQYSEELIQAYINGEFTNLTSGTVYNKYDRTLNNTKFEDDKISDLHIGVDFNIEHTSGIVTQIFDNKMYVIEEILDVYNTEELVQILEDKYLQSSRTKRNIYIYPDASGRARKTSSSTTDHKLLQGAGFKVIVDGTNPRVQDRVNNVNSLLCNFKEERRLYINLAKCPALATSLEQQAYDKAGIPEKINDIDHPLDALGYVVTKKFPIKFTRRVITNEMKNTQQGGFINEF